MTLISPTCDKPDLDAVAEKMAVDVAEGAKQFNAPLPNVEALKEAVKGVAEKDHKISGLLRKFFDNRY